MFLFKFTEQPKIKYTKIKVTVVKLNFGFLNYSSCASKFKLFIYKTNQTCL